MHYSVRLTPRRCRVALWLAGLAFAQGASAQLAAPPIRRPATTSDLATLDLEQLMGLEVVVGASKRAQHSREVPSFVTVVTASDIKQHDYRTLADVLKAIPSFYVSNDRNYAYVGVRGFDRPGDYSSRVLLLVNGLRTNDNVYDQAYIGADFGVDLALVDRIEFIRGPSAAIYGSNAFFAVINVVTKKGRDVEGVEASGTVGSYGTRSERTTYGQTFRNGVDVVASATYSDSKGQSLYFKEFDTPATNNGWANNADYESFHKMFAAVTKDGLSFETMNSARKKGIPTASFETRFNDPRSYTIDGLTLASVKYDRSFASAGTISTRLHAGRWSYAGRYSYDSVASPEHDGAVGQWWGVDVDGTRSWSRHFVTAGVEFRDNFRMDQESFLPEPFTIETDLHNRSRRWGLYAQDEIKLASPLSAYAGLRLDHYETFGAATSPRVGLIYTPSSGTTVKVLGGRAFRAPNAYELYYNGFNYQPNPDLQPEHIATLELIAQQFIGSGIQLTAATFRNRLSNLISQHVDSTTGNFAERNADEIESHGVEFGIEVNRGTGPRGELTYSLQRTENVGTHEQLTNSPRAMAKLQLRAPLPAQVTAGFDAQYVSARRTEQGNTAPPYTVANLTLSTSSLFKHVELSASVFNLFDAVYGAPTADTHVQDVILQDGRNFRVTTTLRF